ncbi:MAG: YCF48-related protein [Ignavibacteria bacterium]
MKRNFLATFLILLTLIFVSNSYSQQDVSGWYWLNGRPTGNTLNWVKIINSNTIYAVGNFGTFMKSTDGGDTWSVNSQVGAIDNSPTGGGATRVLNAGWFFDANTGMVGGQSLSGNPGVISRTTNAGNTWTYIQYNGSGGTVTNFYFINSTTGFLCGNSVTKARKTTDAGLTWTDISGNLPSATFTSVYAFDANKIIVTSDQTKIYTTTDGGTVWNESVLPTTLTTLTDVYFKNANTGYVCGNPNYFAYTTNAGSTWTQSNPPSTVGQRRLRYSGGAVYLGGAYTEIYKSTNDGVTWTPISFVDGSNPDQPFSFIMYGLDVNGSDIAVVGNAGALNISNDAGSTWRNKNYSVSNVYNNHGNENYSGILVRPADGSLDPANYKIWLGPSGGGKILYSSNGGASWTGQITSHTTSIFQIDFVNSNTGFAAGGNAFSGIGQMSKTTNSGTNWIEMTLDPENSGHQINSVDFIDVNTGWIFGGLPFNLGITCAKTTNGGSTWIQQPNNVGYNSSCQGKMADVNTGWFLGNVLFKTTNGGNNWIQSTDTVINTVAWSSLFVFNKDVIYLNGDGTSSGQKKVIRSTDGGTTWTDLTSNLLDFTVFKTYWLNLKYGIVSGTNGYSAKTTNGGLSWTSSNPGGSTTVGLSLPDKNTWYTIGDRNTYFQVWRKLDNITSISLNLTMEIEGFWNGTTMVGDTVTVQLRSSTAPYAVIDQSKEFVNKNGYATYEFNSAPSGSYYITLQHRNALETWSSAPVAMTAGGNIGYDFTTSASQAYGNNEVLKSGKYCLYSGEVTRDGTINLADIVAVSNSIVSFKTGYVPTDLDGNKICNLTDLLIGFNNSISFVSVKRP